MALWVIWDFSFGGLGCMGPWLCNVSSCGSDGLFDGSQNRVDSSRMWFLGGFVGNEVDLWWFCLLDGGSSLGLIRWDMKTQWIFFSSFCVCVCVCVCVCKWAHTCMHLLDRV